MFDPLSAPPRPYGQDSSSSSSSISTAALSAQDCVLAFERLKFNGSIGFLLGLVLAFLELYSSSECESGKRKDTMKNRMSWSQPARARVHPKREIVYDQVDLGRRKDSPQEEVPS